MPISTSLCLPISITPPSIANKQLFSDSYKLLPRGDIDSAQHFRLIRLAIADKQPDFSGRRFSQSAIFKVLGKPCLIYSHGCGQAHGGIRHLPETGHRTRVCVRTKAAPVPTRGENFSTALRSITPLKMPAHKFPVRHGAGEKSNRHCNYRQTPYIQT